MAPHTSTLAWKIPWMEEPGRLQSIALLRVGHNWATSLSLSCFLMLIPFVFFWNAYDFNVWALNIVPEVSYDVLFSFYYYFFHFSFYYFFSVSSIYFHLLSSSSLIFLLPHYSTVGSLQKVFSLSYCIVHYWLIILYFFYVLVEHLLHLLNPCV